MESKRKNFYEFSLEELEAYMLELGEKKFRAHQLHRWVYAHGITDFSEMSNIAKSAQKLLREHFDFPLLPMKSHRVSQDGTQKFLFEVAPGESVESVLIPSPGRLTLCVSSEVGCNLACQFCFTGKQKLKFRLSAADILRQFLQTSVFVPEGERITNMVFMGMGEPLDNPEAVFKAIEILHSPGGLNFSRKKITVSTSGIVPLIPLVTRSGVRLAVSLNGSNNEVRSQIMPVNKRWPIEVLLEACREHSRQSKDKVTLEYVLLKGVTDSVSQARELFHLTKNVPCKINIIPFNEHPGSGFHRPSEAAINAFHKELMRLGVHVLRRKTMGRDIYAACGQLNSVEKNHPQTLSI